MVAPSTNALGVNILRSSKSSPYSHQRVTEHVLTPHCSPTWIVIGTSARCGMLKTSGLKRYFLEDLLSHIWMKCGTSGLVKFLKINKNSFKQFLLYSWWDKSKLRAEVFVPKTLGSFMLFVRPYLSVIDQTLPVVSSESYVRLYSTAPNQPLRVNSIQMCLKIQTRSYVLFSFKLTLI